MGLDRPQWWFRGLMGGGPTHPPLLETLFSVVKGLFYWCLLLCLSVRKQNANIPLIKLFYVYYFVF